MNEWPCEQALEGQEGRKKGIGTVLASLVTNGLTTDFNTLKTHPEAGISLL